MLELIASTLRLSTPLLFGASGGLLAERSGVATICLEGAMLGGAWAAAVVNYWTGNPWWALIAAIVMGMTLLSLHALLCLVFKADQIVSGIAVNLLAAGITPLLTKYFFTSPTNTPGIPMAARFTPWEIPLLGRFAQVGELFHQMPLVWLALLTPFALQFLITKTRFGLWIVASGDAPLALRTSGRDPLKVRWASLLLGGALAALGGAYLSISHSSQFTRDMTGGRGYIALTALIFGKWKPLPTLVACLFFGFTDALQIRLQSATLFGIQFPVQFLQALPYAITLVVLVGLIGRSRAPLTIGKPL